MAGVTEWALREWARSVGVDRPDQEWLLSDYDTWERNPYYRGKPGPHPEDEEQFDSDAYLERKVREDKEARDAEWDLLPF